MVKKAKRGNKVLNAKAKATEQGKRSRVSKAGNGRKNLSQATSANSRKKNAAPGTRTLQRATSASSKQLNGRKSNKKKKKTGQADLIAVKPVQIFQEVHDRADNGRSCEVIVSDRLSSPDAAIDSQSKIEPEKVGGDSLSHIAVATPISRPPMRKIVGGKGGAVVIQAKPIVVVPQLAEKDLGEQSNDDAVQKVKHLLGVPWEPLEMRRLVGEKALSSAMALLVDAVRKACEEAARWPFAFARIISAIPSTIGMYEFLAVVLSDELATPVIARFMRIESEQVDTLHGIACERLRDKFSELCSELCRKWEMVVSGNGANAHLLIERYLVDGIDRSVQMLIGHVLVRAIGVDQNAIVSRNVMEDQDSLSIVRFGAPLMSEATN